MTKNIEDDLIAQVNKSGGKLKRRESVMKNALSTKLLGQMNQQTQLLKLKQTIEAQSKEKSRSTMKLLSTRSKLATPSLQTKSQGRGSSNKPAKSKGNNTSRTTIKGPSPFQKKAT